MRRIRQQPLYIATEKMQRHSIAYLTAKLAAFDRAMVLSDNLSKAPPP